MMSAQKIAGIYKSSAQREVQPAQRLDKLDKYESQSHSSKERNNGENFKEILQKELAKKERSQFR